MVARRLTYLDNPNLLYTDPNNWGGSETLTPPSQGAGTKQMITEFLLNWNATARRIFRIGTRRSRSETRSCFGAVAGGL